MGSLLANDKNIPNRDDGKTFQTEGLKKAAKDWPQGRCGEQAALGPWLLYIIKFQLTLSARA